MSKTPKNKPKKKFDLAENFPDSFVILFFILLLVTVATHFIPAGAFDKIKVAGKEVAKAGSFHYIKSAPVGFMGFFSAIPLGMQAAAPLMFMIFLIGGSIRVFDSTGAIRNALTSLMKIFGKDKGPWVLGAIVIFFALLGAFPSMFEATIPFAPICVSVALALGYDVVVGVAIGLIGIVVGWTAGPTNPWTVGIGQSLAQLPMFSGFVYRMVILVVLTTVSIWYILRYAKKVKADKMQSVVADVDTSECNSYKLSEGDSEFTLKQKLVLLTLAATIGVILYGTYNWKWGLTQMSAFYIVGGIAAGLIAGYSGEKIVHEFMEGGKGIFMAAMAVGLARGIQVVMDSSHIGDTLVYFFSLPLQHLPSALSAVGMFIVQSILNFFIPSGSGLAMVTMPIMIPLSDVIHLNRQIAILAFQFGDGLSNLCFPTTAVTIAFLAVGKVPFNKWLKFVMPFLLIVWIIAALFLMGAVGLNWA